jgi:ABC-type transporter lipoprotein component MlaA
MVNLNMKDFLNNLRSNFEACANESLPNDLEFGMAAFDRATAQTVVGLVDGATPEPKKRTYTRKTRTANPPPSTE